MEAKYIKIRTQNAAYQNLSTKHLIGHRNSSTTVLPVSFFELSHCRTTINENIQSLKSSSSILDPLYSFHSLNLLPIFTRSSVIVGNCLHAKGVIRLVALSSIFKRENGMHLVQEKEHL